MKWLQLKYEYERNEGHTTVYCFSHVAQMSKLPTAGFDEEPAVGNVDLGRVVYVSSSSSSPSLSLFLDFFAFFSLASAALLNFCFLAGDEGSSNSSETYPDLLYSLLRDTALKMNDISHITPSSSTRYLSYIFLVGLDIICLFRRTTWASC